jgi:hypothetical protein
MLQSKDFGLAKRSSCFMFGLEKKLLAQKTIFFVENLFAICFNRLLGIKT